MILLPGGQTTSTRRSNNWKASSGLEDEVDVIMLDLVRVLSSDALRPGCRGMDRVLQAFYPIFEAVLSPHSQAPELINRRLKPKLDPGTGELKSIINIDPVPDWLRSCAYPMTLNGSSGGRYQDRFWVLALVLFINVD